MKNWLLVLILIIPCTIKAQIITTIAGGGTGGDGTPALSASIYNPSYFAFDVSGNLYFSESLGQKIRRIDTNGIITTIAGTGATGFSGDSGFATAAKLNQPCGIAIDTFGNVFFADNVNNRIRKIDISTGIISTIIGSSFAGYSGDSGMASAATLNHPGGICFDKSGNLYIGDDGNYRVRKVNTSGFITNYAGNGLLGWGGDGGLAINAKCNPYSGICIDTNGNLYIAEWGSGTVRKIDPAGIITTIAGDTSSHTYNGDGIPATSAHLDPDFILIADSGAVIISDAVNNRLRKIDVAGIIHTLAGIGVAGYSGDNGPSDSAKINYPTGLAFDHCGHLFFGQNTPPRIRKITFPGTLPSISITSHTSASPGDTVSVTAVVTHSCCPGFSISWMNHGVVFATTTSTSVNYVKNTGTDSITAKLIGCGDTAVSGLQVVTNAKVGISDPNPTNAKMRLYPNPVHTQLIITSTGIIGSVTISNFLGQVFFSKEYNADTAEMNIQSLPVGVYLVKITGSDGSVLTKKLLKE